ncbi:MAG: YggS family pyridoxal phosphate-dependent enzyme, partial [Planctomycetes bacterium]|nr:YggS family pyridoxal phosphate-dependent enzyme [Planctomycetota bacterium]
ARSGRRPEDVLLVAVTKYADMQQVRELVDMGHQDLGESRVQQMIQRAAQMEELLERRRSLPATASARASDARPTGLFEFSATRTVRNQSGNGPTPPEAPGALSGKVRWHLIGHLQRNKVKKAVDVVRLVHSVDSFRLVEEVQQIAFRRDRVVDLLVQVNCAGEEQKYGCAVPAALHLCEQIDSLIHLRVRGLMCMAPYSTNPEDSRSVFQRCREIFEEIRTRGIANGKFNILSMGMSNDYEVAIECGANVVRVGSALFGEPTIETQDADDEED